MKEKVSKKRDEFKAEDYNKLLSINPEFNKWGY